MDRVKFVLASSSGFKVTSKFCTEELKFAKYAETKNTPEKNEKITTRERITLDNFCDCIGLY